MSANFDILIPKFALMAKKHCSLLENEKGKRIFIILTQNPYLGIYILYL